MEAESQPAVLVSCTLCGRLHPPESILAPNPVCAACQGGRPNLALGDSDD